MTNGLKKTAFRCVLFTRNFEYLQYWGDISEAKDPYACPQDKEYQVAYQGKTQDSSVNDLTTYVYS